MKNVKKGFKFFIPDYNYRSLVSVVVTIVNQARRGLISDEDAIDEIVRAYQDHSA